jgi:hypothetical protein
MVVPLEIVMKNHRGQKFRANICEGTDECGESFYLYNPALQAFQYRVQIPNIAVSMIVQDVTTRELRKYMQDGKPIRIKRYGNN